MSRRCRHSHDVPQRAKFMDTADSRASGHQVPNVRFDHHASLLGESCKLVIEFPHIPVIVSKTMTYLQCISRSYQNLTGPHDRASSLDQARITHLSLAKFAAVSHYAK